ncbi:riboflavin synthase [Halobacterium sp. CBA1126]|uniref:riboflavin synthase n=1 Tax=Halobacterium sp. CBA1126 TaxID=2668074 RepID=UPI001323C4BC|nr:riboflavin synthase [Halobacterium sp. CBA1126]
MFTGIIEETGTVERVVDEPDGRRIRVATDFEDLSHGDSVSVGGVCLTVEEHGDGWFTAFTATETLDATTLSDIVEGDAVNLERALPAAGRLDGHIVQGHVDTTTEVVGVEAVGEDWTYTFALPEGHEQYVAQKGSITLDGVSLTVADVDDRAGTFSVAVVPTTYDLTTLSERAPGDRVNVEVDVVAKYVERLDAY